MATRPFSAAIGAALSLSLALAAGSLAAPPQAVSSPESRFRAEHPTTPFYYSGERITSVYGTAFSHGNSPVQSAASFLDTHAQLFGVTGDELMPGSLAADGAHVREFMPDLGDGHLRFTLVSYLQVRSGVPVFRADLRLLVRNEAGFPLVLARSALRPLGDFKVDQGVAAAPNVAAALGAALDHFAVPLVFSVPQVVIWAGTDTVEAARPRLAIVVEGTLGAAGDEGYEKWLIVADAATGALIHTESMIHHVDVTGSVKAMSTPGKKADICTAEVLTPMQYARVSIGANVAYADVNGNFTIPHGGTTPVTVFSGTRGRWFEVWNRAATPAADPEVLSQNVTPPGPVNFVHNQPNTNATHRSGMNAYIQANIVRDFALLYCPTYPTIVNQMNWPVNINVSGTCNAYYDGSSINFYAAGGGCPSTAFGDVVHHEYGHHLVNVAGSGQGQYGEGMSDVMGVLISDDPILGYGFQNNCNQGIRNANNTKQYPCSGGVHDCGQLISGCVWSTRNALIGPYPSTYRQILSSLAVNAILLHAGTEITPQITIDYLTLDDDNDDIGDGTPHRPQIHAGFGAHNMPAPPLTLIKFEYPQGKPQSVLPGGGQAFTVQVVPLAGTPQQNTGVLHLDAEGDGTYAAFPMPQISPNLYGAVFPATTCGSVLSYYVSARTTTNETVTSPSDAPNSVNVTISAVSADIAFTEDFQNNTGWLTTHTNQILAVYWNRAVPTGSPSPSADYDGSGRCFYLHGNGSIGGTAGLVSPTLDATGADYNLSYARWYSNNTGTNPGSDTMVVEISNNNGASWVNVETVGPSGPDAVGGWKVKSFRVADKVAPTNQMKIRFLASDVGGASEIGAGIDDVKLQLIHCGCPSDFNGDGFVDGIDYDQFNAAFEAGNPAADFNGDGFVDGIDYDQFNAAFEAGC